ncbi:hypothetical protein JW823_02160 [bacterium]|nr:hypothetical protein [candidate division CSSED10-310 bacterium]
MNRWIYLCLLFLAPVVWSFPTLEGYLGTTGNDEKDKVFLGWIRSDDFHRYGSFIDQTRYQNRLVYWDYSAVEPQKPRMIALYFFVLGIFGKLTHLRAEHLWFGSLWIAGVCFFLVLEKFLLAWGVHRKQVLWIVAFVILSGGFESVADFAGFSYPRQNNYWMDGFSTFSSFHNPLKIAGITFVMVMLLAWRAYLLSRHSGYLIGTGLLMIITWLVHPNSAMPGYIAILCSGFLELGGMPKLKFNWFLWMKFLPLFIPLCLIGVYILWMKTDPTTANIIRQYNIRFMTEPFRFYPLRYGWILPLGCVGVFNTRQRDNLVSSMLAGWWLGAEFFAHFAGMSGLLFQHMIHLPMALFGAITLGKLGTASSRIKWTCIIILCAGFIFQNVHILETVMIQTREDVWPTSLYWIRGERTAAEYLRSFPAGNVLVSRDSGNKVGWLSLHTVFLGHWGTTPRKGMKEKAIKQFFNPDMSTAWKESFLKEHRIRYVWYGSNESRLGPLDPDLPLKPLISNSAVTVFFFDQIH